MQHFLFTVSNKVVFEILPKLCQLGKFDVQKHPAGFFWSCKVVNLVVHLIGLTEYSRVIGVVGSVAGDGHQVMKLGSLDL